MPEHLHTEKAVQGDRAQRGKPAETSEGGGGRRRMKSGVGKVGKLPPTRGVQKPRSRTKGKTQQATKLLKTAGPDDGAAKKGKRSSNTER